MFWTAQINGFNLQSKLGNQQSENIQTKKHPKLSLSCTQPVFKLHFQLMNESFSYLLPNQQLTSIQVKDEDIIFYQKGKKKRRVYENCQYDELQKQQIKQFRDYASNIFDIKNVPDATVLRYLYSFDFNHPECLEKLKIYLDWYSDPKIQKLDHKTLQLINSGVCYTYGRDKLYRPIIFLNVALIDMTKYTLEDYLSATNAIITLVIQKMFIKGKVQNYLFIIDTGNKNFSSLPLNIVRQMVLKMSYVYSMRMGKLLIINCNYLIKMMYLGVSPFLADLTKQKINLLSTSEVQQGKIKQYVDINQLQQKYCGFRENLTKKWPPQIPGQKKKVSQKKLRQYSFQQSPTSRVQIQESEYFSCQNDEDMFYKFDQKIVMTQGCCSNQQCEIY